MFFFEIVLYVPSEDHERVVVLLHAADRALNRRLVPRHDAALMEQMLALEPLVEAGHLVKTHYTYLCILSGGQSSV